MIEAINISKVFHSNHIETLALNQVNFSVNTGEFIAIMGPSGCGKSTLLNILGMIDKPTSGQYFLNGVEVNNLSERQTNSFRRGKIGFIFQNFNLIDEATVEENIELPLVYLNLNSAERRERVNSVMDRVMISYRRKHFPQQLSGGQQQRVAIARALVTNPNLILADEPTGNLDSKTGLEVMNLLSDLNSNGATIVMVTHSLHDADFSSRIVNLHDGKIITENFNKKTDHILL
jgi:putative ABC transport system ATP-binding protein